MADNIQPNRPRRFSIKPVAPPPVTPPEQIDPAPLPVQEEPNTEPLQSLPLNAPKKRKPKAAPAAVADTSTGALFGNAGHCLAFLGSALGSGQGEGADVHRSPKGSFWVEIDVPSRSMAAMVEMMHGVPFRKVKDGWTLAGPANPVQPSGSTSLRVDNWPEAILSELLVQAPLLQGRYSPAESLTILAPGALGQTILKRAMPLNIQVNVVPSEKIALNGDDHNGVGVLAFQLRAEKGKTIPITFVQNLLALPFVFVGYSWESENRRLLIDVRYRAPLSPLLLVKLLPPGETWVLGAPEEGYWQLRHSGDPVEGTVFLEVVKIPAGSSPAPSDSALPRLTPVSLVHRSGQRLPTDAVLLDDEELTWLATLLKNRPLDESAFLFPGPGRHLLTAPGGLSNTIPVGLPLSWHGPGGFYVELGKDFFPALPETARVMQFGLSPETLIVVTQQNAFRFEAVHMIPAWNLWIGEVPKVEARLSPESGREIRYLSAIFQEKEPAFKISYPAFPFDMHKMDRLALLKDAQRAEIAGNLVKAAQLLEQAGYPGPAGRLYERAAGK